MSPL
ncbi:hypothetical protein CP8484711_1448A, partial [Chlamydia psittaci 84-8471/1]|jgi:hypothetical protein